MLSFIAELQELQNKLLEMGGLVERAIHASTACLVERRPIAPDVLWNSEAQINRLDIEIDEFATRLLALNQPVARDLRFLTAAIKINSDLERMGDLAVNIAQRATSLLNHPPVKVMVDLPQMANRVEAMVHRSLNALVRRDAEEAYAVLLADDEIDSLKDAAYTELLGMIERNTASVVPAFDLIFIAHNLERVADHSTNIAEDVLFMVRGVDVRHNNVVPVITGRVA